MKSKKVLSIGLFLLISLFSFSQQTQVVRGRVIDKVSKSPIIGASVIIKGTSPIIGTATDIDGYFRLDKTPIGRQSIEVSFLSYSTAVINNLIVNSAKEVVLTIELEEKVSKLEQVVIMGDIKDKASNKMAMVSARSFTVEETEKFAGSRGDVARMAMNYAGVSGAEDSRNDIVIRGNSPSGLLWRVEDCNIPSPNHFANQGTTGGPVSMLNNNVMSNSDFFTSAFPAEYGNALSGVFDIKMRNGNNEKYEFLGQVGFNGFELGAEGPISKKNKSSFMVNYRYSTLGFLNALGVSFGTGTAVPDYQDYSYKLNFPIKKGKISVFGIGGNSKIEMLNSEMDEDEENIYYGDGNDDIKNSSNLYFNGISFLKYLNTKTFIKATLSYYNFGGDTDYDTLDIDRNPHMRYKERFIENNLGLNVLLNRKFNSKLSTKAGINSESMSYKLNSTLFDEDLEGYMTLFDQENDLLDDVLLTNIYNQWLYKFNDKLSISGGLNFMHLSLNDRTALEPRVGMAWKINQRHRVNIGYGLHSRKQAIYTYFYQTQMQDGSYTKTNKNLDFSKAHHFVAGYNWSIGENMRLKVEGYYQDLYNVPIEQTSSIYSELNTGSDFGIQTQDSLVNKGTGINYGVEFTLEKFFSKNYYYLLTLSLFESKYKASDNIERNTAFNNNYVVNALIGKEFKLKNNNAIVLDLKTTLAGGQRYIPIDLEKSILNNEEEKDEYNAYKKRFDDYFKLDFKIAYRRNGKKVAQEWQVYIENITNNKNTYSMSYDEDDKKIDYTYQLGIFPMMNYRIYF